ncbi:hypothetical protein [Deinococcus aluminii]|uniref:Uncharacterized protein n=1 Tax=Deinococcus aluminii TaxID=1656885 RepID=A0ABP9XET5_9DEIO
MPELRTLTVRELKEHLGRFDDDLPVCLAVPARDYWGTTLAHPAQVMSQRQVGYSEYHGCFTLPLRDRHGEALPWDEEDQPASVLMLGVGEGD